jgi:hypothetical protein
MISNKMRKKDEEVEQTLENILKQQLNLLKEYYKVLIVL